jgi:hypothetical protein
MMIDARRLVRLEAAAQGAQLNGHTPVLPSRPRGLRYVLKMNQSLSGSGSAHTGLIIERLEPCEGKLSRTVLRGV